MSAQADTHTDTENRLLNLYRHGGDIEIALEGTARRDRTLLMAPAEVAAYNALLRDARQLVPNSVALRDDVGEADETTTAFDAHHALRLTILPTLHNALPDDYITL